MELKEGDKLYVNPCIKPKSSYLRWLLPTLREITYVSYDSLNKMHILRCLKGTITNSPMYYNFYDKEMKHFCKEPPKFISISNRLKLYGVF